MPKFTIAVRGGLPTKLKEDIEDFIEESNLQDAVFVTDIKSHSIDFFIDHDQISNLITRICMRCSLSVVKQGQVNQLGDYIIVLGKLQDGAVVKSMQNQATGLFK